MNRFLAKFVLFFALLGQVFCATGDITAVVRPDGWTVQLTVEGFTTGATYAFGLDARNHPSSTTPYLDVVSLGYDGTGAATTIARKVYLTHILRYPYNTGYLTGSYVSGTFQDGETITQAVSGATALVVGNQSSGARLYFTSVTGTFNNVNVCTGGTSGATFTSTSTLTTLTNPTNDEKNSGSSLVVVAALSDWIYQKDNTGGGNSGTAPTITIPASFVTNTGGGSETSNALSAAAVTQNSTAAFNKPIAQFVTPERETITDSLTVDLVASHYHGMNNEQVAYVEFRATDGTLTVTSGTNTSIVASRSSDQAPVLVYRGTLDTSTLASGLITVNADVYPHVGDSTAVLDSADQSTRREFSPRYFLKDATRGASPPYAYVTSAGNDGTGVWSTTAATAEASPFLTVQGAINAAAAQMPAGSYAPLVGTGTTRPMDGAIVRVGSGTFSLVSAASARPQSIGAVIITRDPNVARTSSIVAFGSGASWRARIGVGTLVAPVAEGAVIFRDITITRPGTLAMQGEAATLLEIIFDDVTFNNESRNASMFSSSSASVFGMAASNPAASWLGASAAGEWRIWRGVSLDAADLSMEGYCVVGSYIQRTSEFTKAAARTASGSVIAFNRLTARGVINGVFQQGDSESVTGMALMQNLIETSGIANGPNNKVGGDNFTGNVTNVVHIHNTYVGFDIYGRSNFLYNDTTGTFRTHKFVRSAGNIQVQINTKHDVFKTNGAYTQAWPYLNGVGALGEFSQFLDAGGGGASGFGQNFSGLGTNIGTSASVRNDPLFTSYQGTTSGPSAGAGNGTYTISPNSPAKQLLGVGLLRFDLAGVIRPSPTWGNTSTYDAAGAYAAPGGAGSAWWWGN